MIHTTLSHATCLQAYTRPHVLANRSALTPFLLRLLDMLEEKGQHTPSQTPSPYQRWEGCHE